jgi:hypothetical protein
LNEPYTFRVTTYGCSAYAVHKTVTSKGGSMIGAVDITNSIGKSKLNVLF